MKNGAVMQKTVSRPAGGNFVVELPFVLTVIFILLMVPMINLVTVTYRAYLVRTAALESVHRAARANSFITSFPASNGLPEQQSAQAVFATYIQAAVDHNLLGAPKLIFPSPALCCVAQPIGGGNEVVYTAVIPPTQIHPDLFEYYYELRGRAVISPLLPLQSRWLPEIPGINTAITINVTARQMVEKPLGLAF